MIFALLVEELMTAFCTFCNETRSVKGVTRCAKPRQCFRRSNSGPNRVAFLKPPSEQAMMIIHTRRLSVVTNRFLYAHTSCRHHHRLPDVLSSSIRMISGAVSLLGSVEIQRELMTAEQRWSIAAKLLSVLSARRAIGLLPVPWTPS